MIQFYFLCCLVLSPNLTQYSLTPILLKYSSFVPAQTTNESCNVLSTALHCHYTTLHWTEMKWTLLKPDRSTMHYSAIRYTKGVCYLNPPDDNNIRASAQLQHLAVQLGKHL